MGLSVVFRPRRVYPRACGGTVKQCQSVVVYQGLSPRLRGNRGRDRPDALHGGSIPAPAGEPSNNVSQWSCIRVYPRACGGTEDVTDRMRYMAGLSPRLRGNRQVATLAHGHQGSIPAPAGEPN